MDQLRQWLKQRLARLDKVQHCSINRDGVIITKSWLGTQTQIYLLDGVPKIREIKSLLNDNTNVGVGSLFIVNATFAPAADQTLAPPEWMQAIHDLSDEKLYVYQAQAPQIDEIHLALMGHERYQVHYKADIAINTLHFYRRWIKLPSLKGNWLAANFGTDRFWKDADYVAARHAEFARRQTPPEHNPYQYTSEFRHTVGQTQNGSIPQRPKTRLELAYEVLELPAGAGCDQVKTQFRKLAMQVHPDVSNLPKAEAEAKFKLISDAYNLIREQIQC
jgi:hypothetical protein